MSGDSRSAHQLEDTEIDVSKWEPAGEEQLGTKPKRWLTHPSTDERWLMKYATFSEPLPNTKYRKGDDWAERIAFSIAEALGIPAAPVELAYDGSGGEERFGTICRSVLHDQEILVNGDELLGESGIHVSRLHRSEYTVTAAMQALHGVEPPADADQGLTAQAVFVSYLLLDALVGNTDRHEENWSVVSQPGQPTQRRLAPTFDHASSLGFLLSDDDKLERLGSKDGNRTPEGYADRAKTPFAGHPHPFAALEDAWALLGQDAGRSWPGQGRDVDDLVTCIWAVPQRRMSDASKQFAERMLRHNWRRLTT